VAPVPGASVYTWSVPAGTNIVSGQGTTTLVVSWPFSVIHAGVKGDICVATDNTGACGASTPSCLYISVQLTAPVRPNSISGPAKACVGDVAVYSVAPTARADYYVWTLPAGVSVVGATDQNIITLSFDAGYAGGLLSVRAGNACGEGANRDKGLGINILPAPASISGPASGVCGAVGVMYTASSVSGASSYFWTVPAGATIAGGQGTQTLLVDFSGSYGTGAITVAAVNNCGTGTVRSMTVKGAPGTPGPISGPVSVCTGSTHTYDIAVVAGATSYNWTLPAGAIISAGAGTKTIDVTYGAAPASGQTLSVRAVNSCGISSVRTLFGITISNCPRLGESTAAELSAFPNPVSEVLNITFQGLEAGNANLRLVDVTGRVVYDQAQEVVSGLNSTQVRVKGMASGIYTLQLQLKDRTEQLRIFVE
jgi:hypothetical protein